MTTSTTTSIHANCTHPKTRNDRAACRRANTRRMTLVPMINDALAARYVAATRESDVYDHAEYERCSRVAAGLIIAFTEGDEAYAAALEDAWLDSNEDLDWYLQWSRDELVYNARTYSTDAEGDAIARRLGLYDDDNA